MAVEAGYFSEVYTSAIYQHGIASSHEHITVDSGGFCQALEGSSTP